MYKPTFELGTIPYVRAQGPGCSPSDMASPGHPPVQGHIKIRYIIYKRDALSVYCSMLSVPLSLLKN
jgi:hypothetical protein